MLPHALIQPPIPPAFLAPYVSPTGIQAWAVRLLRLGWSLWVSLPLQLVNLLTSLLLETPILPTYPGRDLKSSTITRFVQTLVWSATWGFLPPGAEPVLDESARTSTGPRLSMWLYGSEKDGVAVRAEGVRVDPVGEERCKGVVRDGFGGKVKRKKLAGSWLWREGKGMDQFAKGSEKARAHEKVVLYFVGGGYISGEPLVGPFVFNLIRSSPIGTRVFGISYRLAQQPSTSFPAALQDALAAWSYLIHDRGFAPENITCAGDSAGGGLIWSLITYLGVLQTEGIKDLGLPGQVALFSPWLDLTLSHPTFHTNAPFDMLNRGQCITASSFYLRNLDVPAPAAPTPASAAAYGAKLTRASQLLERESFDRLGAAHPIFSPSALALWGKLADKATAADAVLESAATVDTTSPISTPTTTTASSSPTDYSASSALPSTSTSPTSTISSSSLPLPLATSSSPMPRPLALLLLPLLASKTRFLIHSGTAELFASEIALLASTLRGFGLPVEEVLEPGMAHGGAQCMVISDRPEGGRWLGGGKAARKAGRMFGAWLAGGGTREGGGEGWVWGD